MKEINHYRLIVILLWVLTISSCSTTKTYSPAKNISSLNNKRQSIVNFAKQQIGDSYKYGAKGPNSFDCSGLVSYVYTFKGITASGSAAHLFNQGRAIALEKALPGDLIFFRKNGRIFHVSIVSQRFSNNLWVIHSTSSKGVVEEDVMSSSYWRPMIYKVISLNSLKK